MTRFVLSPRAKADLDEIWDYTAERWGMEQAENYVRMIASAIDRVVADPRLGRPCDEIREGYRRYRVRGHVLFYRLSGGRVDVVRILRGSMDFDRHL